LVLEIPYKYVEINPYKKEAGFMALNPRGLVPTVTVDLQGERKVVCESVVLCEWLEEM
jgi:glutathione S-transferase